MLGIKPEVQALCILCRGEPAGECRRFSSDASPLLPPLRGDAGPVRLRLQVREPLLELL